MFRFQCATCKEWHEGMPSFGASAPLYYYSIPEKERSSRCKLTSDTCIVDGEFFFVRGCIEIPVRGVDEPFVWGAWTSLSSRNFDEFITLLDEPQRTKYGPYFGWMEPGFKVYPDAGFLKVMVHLRNNGMRPLLELEPTDHPLAVEQREGITVERVAEIYAAYMH